jgi:hypothetical protein
LAANDPARDQPAVVQFEWDGYRPYLVQKLDPAYTPCLAHNDSNLFRPVHNTFPPGRADTFHLEEHPEAAVALVLGVGNICFCRLVVYRVDEGRVEVTVKAQLDMNGVGLDFEEDTTPLQNLGLATLLAAAASCRIAIQDKMDFVDQEVVHGYGLEGGDSVEKMT